MVMKRCSNGHFYDNSKYQQCPYCSISNSDMSRTVPIVVDRPANMSPNAGAVGKTVAKPSPAPSMNTPSDDERTVSLFQSRRGIDPVVGWLVCIEGVSKGMDYRIKPERNFIGRDSSMDIAIEGDNSISRKMHAIISYSSKNNSFKLAPGEGHSIIYLNNEEVYSPMTLRRGDIIEMGETVLMFIPMCGEDFRW